MHHVRKEVTLTNINLTRIKSETDRDRRRQTETDRGTDRQTEQSVNDANTAPIAKLNGTLPVM
jgi:hypothetical protein